MYDIFLRTSVSVSAVLLPHERHKGLVGGYAQTVLPERRARPAEAANTIIVVG